MIRKVGDVEGRRKTPLEKPAKYIADENQNDCAAKFPNIEDNETHKVLQEDYKRDCQTTNKKSAMNFIKNEIVRDSSSAPIMRHDQLIIPEIDGSQQASVPKVRRRMDCYNMLKLTYDNPSPAISKEACQCLNRGGKQISFLES